MNVLIVDDHALVIKRHLGSVRQILHHEGDLLTQAAVAWWFLAGMQPLAGVVFALDGVLMGAGDVGYLRTVTIGAALVGFVPLSLLAVPLGWGLAGVWTGLTLFIALRLVAVLVRVAGERWLAAPDTVTA